MCKAVSSTCSTCTCNNRTPAWSGRQTWKGSSARWNLHTGGLLSGIVWPADEPEGLMGAAWEMARMVGFVDEAIQQLGRSEVFPHPG